VSPHVLRRTRLPHAPQTGHLLFASSTPAKKSNYSNRKARCRARIPFRQSHTGLDINHFSAKFFRPRATQNLPTRSHPSPTSPSSCSNRCRTSKRNSLATNDAEAYYRMIRQSIPAVRDLPKSQSNPSPLPTHRPAPTRTTTPVAQQSTASVPAPAPPPRPQPPSQQQVSSAPSPVSTQPPNAPNPVHAFTSAPVPRTRNQRHGPPSSVPSDLPSGHSKEGCALTIRFSLPLVAALSSAE